MMKYFDIAYSTGLNLEFGFNGNMLDGCGPEEFEMVGDMMKTKDMTCTLQAPLFDLSSGAFDSKILDITRLRYN
jgi:hypothetical protein